MFLAAAAAPPRLRWVGFCIIYYPLTGAQHVVNIARVAKNRRQLFTSLHDKGEIMLLRGDNFITNLDEASAGVKGCAGKISV